MTPAPIYVVDDDASVRDAVGRLVRSAGWKVETFASAQEFLASPWADVPSCLILDVRLPGLSGLDLQQRLAKSGARTSIIFLSGHGDIPTSVRAIKAGALEFLTKPYADADLIAAIEQGLAHAERERTEAKANMKEFPPFRLDTVNQCLWRRVDTGNDDRILLTPKAFAVLRHLVAHAGRLVTQDALLDAVWPDTHVTPAVLNNQILNIRQALGDRPKNPVFIETLPRRGYRFIAPVRDGGPAQTSDVTG